MELELSEKEKIAWIAGILEGEGCFTLDNSSKNVVIKCVMTDEDTIKRLKLWSGDKGRINGPYYRPNRKPIWQWRVAKGSDVEILCHRILPFMGIRRSDKIQVCLDFLNQKKIKQNERKVRVNQYM